ncbi:MAG: glycosyltransferase [Candidatus Ratteibacteria bacterium]|jgi:glycosyltransferase involved in cell wall biosynthesis
MTEKPPMVSVVLPTYDRAHLIGRAIQSVLDQTYPDFEIIVVDDGSTDNTEAAVKDFKDKRIRYIKHGENKGGPAARNTGIKAARGKYIAFQDSDDEWLPEKLDKQIRVFETAPPEVGIVYTDMQRVNENGDVEYWHSPKVTNGSLINPKTADYQVSRLGISTLIKKNCFDTVGLFDERFPRWQDLDLYIRLAKRYRFNHIKEPLYKYYATKGVSSNANDLIVAWELLLEKYSEEIKSNRKFYANQYFIMSIALCSGGELKSGRGYLIKALKTYPLNIKFFRAILASVLGKKAYKEAAVSYRKIKKLLATKHEKHWRSLSKRLKK